MREKSPRSQMQFIRGIMRLWIFERQPESFCITDAGIRKIPYRLNAPPEMVYRSTKSVAKRGETEIAYILDDPPEMVYRSTDTAQLFGWDVPLTTHEIKITYDGMIKAGYNFEDIDISVDQTMKQIHITLPKKQITDNIINEEDAVCESRNNVFNPINADEATNFLSGVKKEAL